MSGGLTRADARSSAEAAGECLKLIRLLPPHRVSHINNYIDEIFTRFRAGDPTLHQEIMANGMAPGISHCMASQTVGMDPAPIQFPEAPEPMEEEEEPQPMEDEPQPMQADEEMPQADDSEPLPEF
jgi:hypothetical protein